MSYIAAAFSMMIALLILGGFLGGIFEFIASPSWERAAALLIGLFLISVGWREIRSGSDTSES